MSESPPAVEFDCCGFPMFEGRLFGLVVYRCPRCGAEESDLAPGFKAPLPDRSTHHAPGTPGKIAVLCARAATQRYLFHPEDPVAHPGGAAQRLAPGVSLHKRRFRARPGVGGRKVDLGLAPTEAEAEARAAAARELGRAARELARTISAPPPPPPVTP